MRSACLLAFSLLLACILSPIANCQQLESRDQNSDAVKAQPSAAAAMRQRLLDVRSDPIVDQSSEPLVKIETFALRAPVDPQPTKTGTWLEGISTIYQTAADQRRLFTDTAKTMEFEQSGLYFRRDLYSITKGLIVHSWWGDRIDLGVYKRRLQNSSTHVTGGGFGQSQGRQCNSYIFKDGRDIFVGLRFNLDKFNR
jgi:hypothetical protein